jgi:hypothetical protein
MLRTSKFPHREDDHVGGVPGEVQRDVVGRFFLTKRSRWLRGAVAWAALVAAIAALARSDVAAAAGSTTSTTSRPTVVPSFVGLTLAQARDRARGDHGRVDVVLWAPTSRPRGDVVSQAPTSWPVGLVVSSGPWTTPHARLAGERAGPVAPECAVVVHLEADGNVTPLLCAAHSVNVGAWLFYSKGDPALLTLARTATKREIDAALCDATPTSGTTSPLTLPERLSDYILVRSYDGWTTPQAAVMGPVLATHPGGAACLRAVASVGS